MCSLNSIPRLSMGQSATLFAIVVTLYSAELNAALLHAQEGTIQTPARSGAATGAAAEQSREADALAVRTFKNIWDRARQLRMEGRLVAAEGEYGKMLTYAVDVFPAEHWAIREARVRLASHQQLLKFTGEQREDVTRLLVEWERAWTESNRGHYQEAIKHGLETLKICRRLGMDEDLLHIDIVNVIAQNHDDLHGVQKGSEWHKMQVECLSRLLGETHPEAIAARINYGYALSFSSSFSDGHRELLRVSRLISELAKTKNDYAHTAQLSVSCSKQLGWNCSVLGDHAGAQRWYECALQRVNDVEEWRRDGETVLALRDYLAWAKVKQGRVDEGTRESLAVLKELEDQTRADKGLLGTFMIHVSNTLCCAGRVQESSELLMKAEKLLVEVPGDPDGWRPAYNDVKGRIALQSNDLREAARLFSNSLEECERRYGADHPVCSLVLADLMAVANKQGEIEKASVYRRRHEEILAKHPIDRASSTLCDSN